MKRLFSFLYSSFICTDEKKNEWYIVADQKLRQREGRPICPFWGKSPEEISKKLEKAVEEAFSRNRNLLKYIKRGMSCPSH